MANTNTDPAPYAVTVDPEVAEYFGWPAGTKVPNIWAHSEQVLQAQGFTAEQIFNATNVDLY